MENKKDSQIHTILELEEILMDAKALTGMILALNESLYNACNWSKENYRYMVSYMHQLSSSMTKDLECNFKSLLEKEKKPN